jgi:hypothetical protein
MSRNRARGWLEVDIDALPAIASGRGATDQGRCRGGNGRDVARISRQSLDPQSTAGRLVTGTRLREIRHGMSGRNPSSVQPGTDGFSEDLGSVSEELIAEGQRPLPKRRLIDVDAAQD